MSRLNVLVVTKIFPNAVHPDEAPYNRLQFAALSQHCDVQVLATIPWFPGASRMSSWPVASAAPAEEIIDGLRVRHPRFLYVPKVAPRLNGPLYAASMVPEVMRLERRPDVIVGAFAYPDGYAAVCLGRLLNVPAVVKVHGSDIDVLPHDRRLCGPIQWGLRNAARVVAVSRQLAEGVKSLGVPRERIDTILNGVDTRVFRPRSRAAARAALDRSPGAKMLLFVGSLSSDKGVLELLAAFDRLSGEYPRLELVLAGAGPEEAACRAAAARHPGRITVTGYLPHSEVARWMAACDALVLPSRHEGTPNVVLEALASGRRAVATRVGGIPDILRNPELGELIPPRDEAALSHALRRAIETRYNPRRIAALAGLGDWDESARALHGVLERAAAGHAEPVGVRSPEFRVDLGGVAAP